MMTFSAVYIHVICPKCNNIIINIDVIIILGIADFIRVGARKMTDGRSIAGRSVLVIRDVGEITSFQRLCEVAALMTTLQFHLLYGKLFNTGLTN